MSVEDGALVLCSCGLAMLAVGDDEEHVYACPDCDPMRHVRDDTDSAM